MKGPRPVLQLDSQDCGPACLRYVLNVFGGDVPLSQIRDRCDVGEGGVSLLELRGAASELGLTTNVYRAQRFDESLDDITPWIAQFRNREAGTAHFVVVRHIDSRRVKFMDPAVGDVSLPREAFIDEWTHILAKFSPENVVPRRRSDFRWIRHQLLRGRRRNYLLITLLFALLVSLLGIASAYLAQGVIDAMVRSPFRGAFWASLVALLSFFVVRYAVSAGVGYTVERLAARLSIDSTGEMTDRIPRLSWKYTSMLRHGDIVNRVKDPAVVEKFLIVQCGQLAGTVLTFVLGMTWVSISYPTMLPAVIVACLLMVANFKIFRGRLVSISYRQKLSQVGMDTILMDYARCREVLTSRARANFLLDGFTSRFREFNRLHVRRVGLLVWMGLGVALCPVLVMSWSVFWLWRSGSQDASAMGHLVFQLTATGLIFGGIAAGLSVVSNMDMMRVSFDRMMDVYTGPTDEAEVPDGDGDKVGRPVSELELSEFEYLAGSQRQKISFSLSMPRGDTSILVAVTGANGVGKSSFLRALAGVSDSLGGEFLLNGRIVIGKSGRSACISYMPQTDQLFTGSVADNVFLGDEVSSKSNIEDVATVLRLPRGARTVGELSEVRVFNGGETFSGGQGRRVALARAVQRDAPVLLLDEPFANVDRGSVIEILELLRRGVHDCVFIVTHDETVLSSADRVIDLGELVMPVASEGVEARVR